MSDGSRAKKVGRAAAYPAIRLLEPRFADLVRRLTDTRQAVHDEGAATRGAIAGFENLIGSYAASSGESLAYVGTQLRELADELRAAAPAPDPAPAPAVEFAAAFALRALARVAVPARVVDVGGAERRLGAELATLGYEVLGVDPRPYRHEHPALEPLPTTLEDLGPRDEVYDAAVALDGVSEEGLGALLGLLRPRGLLVAALTGAQLDGWEVVERIHVREHLAGTWVRTDEPLGRAVTLVAAIAR